MKIILGSGLIGLLARKILGPSYKIIPFAKSRFYSFNPALQDNYLVYNEQYKDIIAPYANSSTLYPYKIAWSIGGELINKYDDGICDDWLIKIFKDSVPTHSKLVYKNRFETEVFDIRLNQLYAKLLEEYDQEIKDGLKYGELKNISNGQLNFQSTSIDYTTIISTIPLTHLYKYLNLNTHLSGVDIHYLHVQTSKLDFEGNSQALVADAHLDFYKVSALAPNRYLFYFAKEVQNPGLYLLYIIGQDFDILEGTSVPNALPSGQIPPRKPLEDLGIVTVGATAEWDWCVDAGSAMLRLLTYANTGSPIVYKRML